LGKYVEEENIPSLRVWTSELVRTKETAQHIQAHKENWKALNEIDAVSLDYLVRLVQCLGFYFDFFIYCKFFTAC
jgi:broad specificity phosphatase PhoE